ncbi:MAG: tetraacyldisaccharide 4'-kinase [Myxococcales bacterium]|nr:tetraacyldisaccharide 4'-kinase [Myxococcales bacterium]MDH5566732.1 tetraacyldisaccharide 4'-kinase [Myxococcales bacterium]
MSVRAGWLEQRQESLARRLALAPLVPAAWIYAACAGAHRALYEQGVRAPRKLPCRVVSVGNLVVGGTAKTPLAAWIADSLHRRGRKVVLASRGYRRAGDDPVYVVSDGRHVCGRVERAGDEPMLLAAHAPGVPVLVGRDRGIVGLRAHSLFGADVIVLDDGFQHHRLARDVDVLMFDGGLGLGNRRVLPRGPLREPLCALRRADAIGVVDGPLPDTDESLLARRARRAYRFCARRRPAALRPLAGGSGMPPQMLDGAELGLLAALAQPRGFRRTLEALGAKVVAERVFRDHHAYRPADLRHLAREAPLWVTTEKDAVKITPAWVGKADVRVLSIELAIERAGDLLDWLEERLR